MVPFFLLLCSSFCALAQQKPVSVIFDSDMGPDYDDVGAITVLHAFADSGQANILATIASTNYEGVAGVFSVLNTYFQRPDLPIAVPKGKAVDMRDWQHWSDTLLANYPHSVNSNSEVPDASELYRKLLAAQPDRSVTIITVGFFTNLANLLQSAPDSYSKLNGKTGAEKSSPAGKHGRQSFQPVKNLTWKKMQPPRRWFLKTGRRIICSGFEIGEKIKTGLPLIQKRSHPKQPGKRCVPHQHAPWQKKTRPAA
jgi:pyrimidine-specific ribonucleoside hydrolase